jgi:hypothetical protein
MEGGFPTIWGITESHGPPFGGNEQGWPPFGGDHGSESAPRRQEMQRTDFARRGYPDWFCLAVARGELM